MAAIPTILKGDDSGAINITLATGRTYTGATLVVAYQGVTRSFTNLTPGQTIALTFSHEETANFALKTAPLLMRLIGQYGAEETVENAEARIRVTDCLAEVNAGGSFIVQPGGTMVDPTKVPITDVGDMAARYTLADLQAKVNQIVRVLAQRSLLSIALVCGAATAFGGVNVQTARLDALYNDALVVTNVTGGGEIDTNAVKSIVNAEVGDGGTNAVKTAVTDVATIKADYTTHTAATNAASAAITNAVDSGYLCTVEKAAAMTNALSTVKADSWYGERGFWRTNGSAGTWILCRYDGSGWTCFDSGNNLITITRDGANMHMVIRAPDGMVIADATMPYDSTIGAWVSSTEQFKLETGWWHDTAANADKLNGMTPREVVETASVTNGGAKAYADAAIAAHHDSTKQDALSDTQIAAIGKISLNLEYGEWKFDGTAEYAKGLRCPGSPSTDYNIQWFQSALQWGRTKDGENDYLAYSSDLTNLLSLSRADNVSILTKTNVSDFASYEPNSIVDKVLHGGTDGQAVSNIVNNFVSTNTTMFVTNSALTIAQGGSIKWQESFGGYKMANAAAMSVTPADHGTTFVTLLAGTNTLAITAPAANANGEARDFVMAVSATDATTMSFSGFTGMFAADASATNALAEGKTTMLYFTEIKANEWFIGRQEAVNVTP